MSPVAFACTVKLLEVEPSSRYAGSLYLVNTFHACIADLTKTFGVLSLVLSSSRGQTVWSWVSGGSSEEREVLTTADPSHPVACLFCLVGL